MRFPVRAHHGRRRHSAAGDRLPDRLTGSPIAAARPPARRSSPNALPVASARRNRPLTQLCGRSDKELLTLIPMPTTQRSCGRAGDSTRIPQTFRRPSKTSLGHFSRTSLPGTSGARAWQTLNPATSDSCGSAAARAALGGYPAAGRTSRRRRPTTSGSPRGRVLASAARPVPTTATDDRPREPIPKPNRSSRTLPGDRQSPRQTSPPQSASSQTPSPSPRSLRPVGLCRTLRLFHFSTFHFPRYRCRIRCEKSASSA